MTRCTWRPASRLPLRLYLSLRRVEPRGQRCSGLFPRAELPIIRCVRGMIE